MRAANPKSLFFEILSFDSCLRGNSVPLGSSSKNLKKKKTVFLLPGSNKAQQTYRPRTLTRTLIPYKDSHSFSWMGDSQLQKQIGWLLYGRFEDNVFAFYNHGKKSTSYSRNHALSCVCSTAGGLLAQLIIDKRDIHNTESIQHKKRILVLGGSLE